MRAVEVGAGVAGAEVNQAEVGVYGGRSPDGSAPAFPGVTRPAIVAELAGAGHGVEAPEHVARVGVVGRDMASQLKLASRSPYDDFAVCVLGSHRLGPVILQIGRAH